MNRFKGKSPQEMIEDSILFGVERFIYKGETFLRKSDVKMGIDPKLGIERRKAKKGARATLQFLGGWKTPVPPAGEYGTGLKTLIQHGYIEKKARKGFKLTKRGKAKMKEMEKPWFFK